MQKCAYTLGLDLGESSLGWALIKLENNEPAGLIDAGVRVFPAVIERSQTSAQPEIKNAERRAKRSARRVKGRRVQRKQYLLAIMQENELFPIENNEMQRLFAREPYELRARALNEKLELFEIGRAFYHLCQRRGFKSNRKSEKDEKETGQIAKEIGQLALDLQNSGARTVGEWLHRKAADRVKLETGNERLRGRHISRAMIEDEFKKIWSAQAGHYPAILTDGLYEDIHYAIFFQRSFELTEERRAKLPSRANALRAPQIAPCSLIPSEKRCPAGEWIAQQFRLLKEINNLDVRLPFDRPRPLSADEKSKLAFHMGRQKSMSFSAMRNLLGFQKEARFNLEAGKREGLKGNIVEATLIDAFGEQVWDSFSERKCKSIRNALIEKEDPEEFEALSKEWGLDESQTEKLLKFPPPQSYLSFSAKAMEILLPYLQRGLDEVHAIIEARADDNLPKPAEDKISDFLPAPKEIPNPNVMRCLYETRKVVNALIREYGKPEKIVVELARDLKLNREQRERVIQTNRDNEKLRQTAAQFYKEHGRENPSGEDLLKHRLWSEQGGISPYSGSPIDAMLLLDERNILQVDHILPYSRSLDNSYQNKVLCFAEENAKKGNSTPYEWKRDSKEFDEMKIRLEAMKQMRGSKRARFYQPELDTDKFIQQKLQDTRYASREVAAFLNLLYPPDDRVGQKRVFTSPGMVTSDLRYYWGVNSILGPDTETKTRTDHRHHAVDAIVIACTDRSAVKRLADASAKHGIDHKKKIRVEPPWENFRNAVEDMVLWRERKWKLGDKEITTQGILVSHRVEKRLAGAFHEETNYGLTEIQNEFVYRVPVTGLSGAKVEKIRDPRIRAIVFKHCMDQDVDPKKLGSKPIPPKVWKTLPMLPVSEKARRKNPALPESIPIRRVRLVQTLEDPLFFNGPYDKPYRAVKTGNNHHMEIIEETDKKGRTKWSSVTVTMFDVVKRVRIERKPMVQRDHGEGKKFVMSLHRNESALLKISDTLLLYRVQKINVSGQLYFRPHSYAGLLKESDQTPIYVRKSASTLNGEITKVIVDSIGRLEPSND